jgi:hypothetical protein
MIQVDDVETMIQVARAPANSEPPFTLRLMRDPTRLARPGRQVAVQNST